MSEVAVAGVRTRDAASVAITAQLAKGVTAEVLSGAHGLETLLPDWWRLAEQQRGSVLFQTPAVIEIWARHFAGIRAKGLSTLVLRKARRPVLIWPLQIERRGFIKVVRGAGAPIGQYDDVLIDHECDVTELFSIAYESLKESLRPDLLMLERVRSDSVLHRALAGTPPTGALESAPFVDLADGASAAFARRKCYAAKQHRKRVRRFEKSGAVAMQIAVDPAEAATWMAEALALKRLWLRDTGRLSRAFIRRATGICLADLARRLSRPDVSPRLVVAKLSLDGKTTAIEAGFAHRRTFHLYLRVFSPEFAYLGPGNILTERMLEWCAANGMERYDMLPPGSRNKAEWQSGEVGVADFALPVTRIGRLYAAIVPGRILPALVGAFYALPLRLRAAAAGAALRM